MPFDALTYLDNFRIQGSMSVVNDPAGNAAAINNAGTLALLTGSLARIAKAGPYSVNQTATFFNHGLSVVPDFIIPILANQSGGGVFSCNVDIDNATTTQVKLSSNAASGLKVYILSFKF